MLAELRATEPPGLPLLDDMRDALVGWPTVRDDPAPLLSTGVCTPEWLEGVLPSLLQACGEVDFAGDDLPHAGVRSDNLFFKGAPVLVDWNIACIGNGDFDVAFWLPSLRLEGGPPQPWEVLPDAGPLAVAVAGFFAARRAAAARGRADRA
jgi:hypothetical protein